MLAEPTKSAAVRSRPSISVVMPAYNAMQFLPRSLPPLIELMRRKAVREVLVVDDGSTDDTARYARSLGARVIRSSGRVGPGGARNEAAQSAIGDLLWFIDADVVVHPDSAEYVKAAFDEPEVVAAFGSYDDRPAALNFGSQYKNLVHHHYHQHADPRASTFWSGCGAVRKDAFLSIGGFDAKKFRIPSVEDVDLGYRLRGAGGEIRLDRRLLSTHLKVWSVVELVRTDVFRRAIPWARMMLSRTEILDDLNVGTAERLRALLAGLTFVSIPLAALLILPWWLLAPLLLTIVTGNWHLFRLFWRARGRTFAAAGLAFHQFYYLYSGLSFAWCWAEARLIRRSPSGAS
jgi:glycosyltransferase involved in cell wall biosynthesis